MGKGNENVKYVPVSEADRKGPTILRDLAKDGKHVNISVEYGPLIETNDEITIKAMVAKRRLAIEADQEGEDQEGYKEEGE